MTDDARRRFAGAGGLYLIITEPVIPHADLVRAAVERGVPVVQLREKGLSDRALTDLARDLSIAVRGSGTIFIVNDRPDIALAAGADGVHLGRTDMNPVNARRLLGPAAIVGVSANTPEEALVAREADVDYIGVGPVFPTVTKPDARSPIGLGGLARLAEAVPDIRRVAVGGIGRANALDVRRAGADFVAVISAICHADDPAEAIDALQAALGGESSGGPRE